MVVETGQVTQQVTQVLGQSIGYIRVSRTDQNLGRQLDGMKLDRVFEDTISGGSLNRPGWNQCREYLREGDTLYVHSIDRLARNLEDLQRTIRELSDKKVVVHFVKENLTFQGNEDPFQMLMFHMVGAFAQFERAMIRDRQREGIARVRREGKPIGRPRKLTDHQWEEIKAEMKLGVRKSELAKRYGITTDTIYVWLSREKIQATS